MMYEVWHIEYSKREPGSLHIDYLVKIPDNCPFDGRSVSGKAIGKGPDLEPDKWAA